MLSPSTRKHRADLAELARLAQADLAVVLRDVRQAKRVRDSLAEVLAQLVATYGTAATALGADWYDELREQAEVRGRFQAIVADLPDTDRTESLAGWAVGPLFGAEPDASAVWAMAAGGLQRIIFDADRETIVVSSVQDRGARGWQREGSGECPFCEMLIARGAVYSEATADFASHDNCRCVAVPVFGGQPVPVKPYVPTQRNITAADRARVRAYLKAHG